MKSTDHSNSERQRMRTTPSAFPETKNRPFGENAMRITMLARLSTNVATHFPSLVLQSRTNRWVDEVTTYFPSGLKRGGMARTSASPNTHVCSPDHVLRSQTRTDTDISLDVDSRDLPSGENKTFVTVVECPARTASAEPVAVSQTRTTHALGSPSLFP